MFWNISTMKNKWVLKLLNHYQSDISSSTSPKCRYYPSCSNYAKGCYEKFNFFKATFLTLKRILRCNPLFKGGYDPVPLTKEEKKEAIEKSKLFDINKEESIILDDKNTMED